MPFVQRYTRQRETERDRERHRETERDRKRQKETEGDRERQRETERDRERQRETEREGGSRASPAHGLCITIRSLHDTRERSGGCRGCGCGCGGGWRRKVEDRVGGHSQRLVL